MSNKFRTDTRDIAPVVRKITESKPGTLPANRIPVFDADGNRRGHVGYKASAATCARFGVPDAALTTKDGRPAWCGKGSNK
jgi:hypothetical protein